MILSLIIWLSGVGFGYCICKLIDIHIEEKVAEKTAYKKNKYNGG